MTPLNVKNLQAGVLVIGAGGAGLRAAIEAKNMGADVLVVSKGGFPSGCTKIAMGAMLCAFNPEDSPNQHFEDTLKGGDYLNNPKLVRLLVDHARERVADLERYGTRFDKENDHYRLFPFKRLGIRVLENVMIVDLVTEKNEVSGAIGLTLETDTLLAIDSQAIILSTGGAGNLYRLTTNPPGVTGDGYALAYKAGARLSGMEFVQSRVCMVYPKGMRGMPPPGDGLVTKGGRFYNALCERYMRKYHPDKLELVTRAQMAICAQREIQAGRCTPNGGVYGDLSGVPEKELREFTQFLKACAEEKFDPLWQPYEWAPGTCWCSWGQSPGSECSDGNPGIRSDSWKECREKHPFEVIYSLIAGAG
jgi:fumarate reductase (CoM/CoB) subunit A